MKLKVRENKFLVLRQELEEKWQDELWDAYGYYLENFRKIELFFNLLHLYIPIEASKINIFQEEDINELEVHISNIEELEAQIFGEKLSDRPKEAKITLDYINVKYSEKKDELSIDERDFLDEVLRKTEKKMREIWNPQEEVRKSDNEIDLKDPLLGIEWLDQEVLKKEISQEQYLRCLSLQLEYWG